MKTEITELTELARSNGYYKALQDVLIIIGTNGFISVETIRELMQKNEKQYEEICNPNSTTLDTPVTC